MTDRRKCCLTCSHYFKPYCSPFGFIPEDPEAGDNPCPYWE